MSCVLSTRCLVKYEMSDAEHAESALSSVKLKYLTTKQIYLPKKQVTTLELVLTKKDSRQTVN